MVQAQATPKEYFRIYTRYGLCKGGPMDGKMFDAMCDEWRLKGGLYEWDRKTSTWVWADRRS